MDIHVELLFCIASPIFLSCIYLFQSILNVESHPDVQLDNRHIMIRGEHTSKVSIIIKQ